MPVDLTTLPPVVLPMVAFCLGIYFIVLILRYVIEVRWPSLCQSDGWNKILRIAPPLIGGIAAALMHKYPFLCTLPTWGTRFIYGCFGGGVSSFGYIVFKAVVQKFFGVRVEADGTKDEDPPVHEHHEEEHHDEHREEHHDEHHEEKKDGAA